MRDTQMTDRPHLEMRWVPVIDEQGCTRAQAVWIEAGSPVTSAVTTAPTPSTVGHAA